MAQCAHQRGAEPLSTPDQPLIVPNQSIEPRTNIAATTSSIINPLRVARSSVGKLSNGSPNNASTATSKGPLATRSNVSVKSTRKSQIGPIAGSDLKRKTSSVALTIRPRRVTRLRPSEENVNISGL